MKENEAVRVFENEEFGKLRLIKQNKKGVFDGQSVIFKRKNGLGNSC